MKKKHKKHNKNQPKPLSTQDRFINAIKTVRFNDILAMFSSSDIMNLQSNKHNISPIAKTLAFYANFELVNDLVSHNYLTPKMYNYVLIKLCGSHNNNAFTQQYIDKLLKIEHVRKNINISDPDGNTALLRAFLNPELIKKLLKHGAVPFSNELLQCIISQNYESAICIIDANPSIINCISNFNTPLDLLCHQNCPVDVARTFIEKGAILCTQKKPEMQRKTLTTMCYFGYYDLLMLLKEYGFNFFTTQGSHKLVPLACKGGHYKIVKMLLEYGFSPNTCIEEGMNSMELALENGYHKIAKLLFQYKGRPTKAFDLLHYFSYRRNIHTIERLINITNDPETLYLAIKVTCEIYNRYDVRYTFAYCLKVCYMLMDKLSKNYQKYYASCTWKFIPDGLVILHKSIVINAKCCKCGADGDTYAIVRKNNIDSLPLCSDCTLKSKRNKVHLNHIIVY